VSSSANSCSRRSSGAEHSHWNLKAKSLSSAPVWVHFRTSLHPTADVRFGSPKAAYSRAIEQYQNELMFLLVKHSHTHRSLRWLK
jgi:hypothetical protein